LSRPVTWILAVSATAILVALSWLPPASLPALRLVACAGLSITGVSPASGRVDGGTSVTITGCALTGATAVKFGRWDAYSFTVDSDSQITAISPGQREGTVDITVTTPSGTSATSVADQFFYYGTCRDVNGTWTPSSPQTIGTIVTISAQAPTCRSPLFEFEMQAPGSQIWQVKQDYSAKSSFVWDTASLLAGSYGWVVKARDATSFDAAVFNVWEGFAMGFYQVNQPPLVTPCTSVTASAAPTPPQQAGTLVTVTAVAAGCTNPRHQFELLAPGSQTWSVVRAYAASNSYDWDTSSLPAGTYRLIVKARDGGSLGLTGMSNPNGSWDSYTTISFNVTSGAGPCTGVTATAALASPQNIGTGVTITASASGCPTVARYQFEMQATGSQTWQVVEAYSTSDAFNWSTSRRLPGTYRFIVKAKDKAYAGATGVGNSNGSWDFYTTLAYTLVSTACTGVTASPAAPTSVSEGTLVVITAHATGCPSPEYQFEFGPGTFSVEWLYGPEDAMYWLSARGVTQSYPVIVKARDESSPGVASSGSVNGSWDAYVMISVSN
jgi:IPT/TIG domain-containing protein